MKKQGKDEHLSMKYAYMPEGSLIYSAENIQALSSLPSLEKAMREGKILEGMATMCDSSLSLHVDLGAIEGVIPREECVLASDGEEIKDIAIITRVGKPVCFKILAIEPRGNTYRAILSRRRAQAECKSFYLSSLLPGDIVPATITHLESFGAFVDVGCGMISLLSIDCISVSRISHPCDRLSVGSKINVVIRSNDAESGRIYVTLKELLGTWSENARAFSVGQTVTGIVRSVESYGVFVELSPNLAGLAELKDERASSRPCAGQGAAVFIKSIIPERMKIKLVLINTYPSPPTPPSLKYYVDVKSVSHLDSWRYSPDECERIIETVF